MDLAAPTPAMRWALARGRARMPCEERLCQRSARLNGLIAHVCMFDDDVDVDVDVVVVVVVVFLSPSLLAPYRIVLTV